MKKKRVVFILAFLFIYVFFLPHTVQANACYGKYDCKDGCPDACSYYCDREDCVYQRAWFNSHWTCCSPVCEPGEKKCGTSSNEIVQCREDGSGYESFQSCAHGCIADVTGVVCKSPPVQQDDEDKEEADDQEEAGLVAPVNLRYYCQENGTKVELSWEYVGKDEVDGRSFDVYLNDEIIAGGLNGITRRYEKRIEPNTTYEYHVVASRGVDRQNAQSIEFICPGIEKPEILPRAYWDANPPNRTKNPKQMQSITNLVLHHVGSGASVDYPIISAQNQHMTNSQYDQYDIAYHYIIHNDGSIYEGRSPDYCGTTGTKSQEYRNIICNSILILVTGDFDKYEPTEQQIDSTVDLMAWLSQEHDISSTNINGHRDHLDETDGDYSCPGDNLYTRMDEIRRQVSARLSGAGSSGGGAEDEEELVAQGTQDGVGVVCYEGSSWFCDGTTAEGQRCNGKSEEEDCTQKGGCNTDTGKCNDSSPDSSQPENGGDTGGGGGGSDDYDDDEVSIDGQDNSCDGLRDLEDGDDFLSYTRVKTGAEEEVCEYGNYLEDVLESIIRQLSR